MRFYGSTGYIMVGSCIKSLLELIFAEPTVTHILSIKAYAHATWAHIITASVLSALLISNVHKIDFDLNVSNGNLLQNSEALNEKEKLSKLPGITDKILTKKIALDDLTMLHDHIIIIQEKIRTW